MTELNPVFLNIHLVSSEEAKKVFRFIFKEQEVKDIKYCYLLFKLHVTNTEIWRNETLVRKRNVYSTKRITHKDRIDELNLIRNDIIEKIDFTISKLIKINKKTIPHTESPGTVYDRMSVLILRDQETNGKKNKLYVKRQINAISLALDFFLQELLDGKKSFIVNKQMKIYNG